MYIINIIYYEENNKLGSSSSISIDDDDIELNRFIRGRRVSVVLSDGKSVDE